MIKRCIIATLVIMMLCSVAFADIPMPRADLYFASATAFLAANKQVTFDCTTNNIHNQIRITAVWLEQKVDNDWVTVKSLTAPASVAQNTISYVAVADYSNNIGTGTFRVGFTVDADGYAISRYSNSRTF